MAREPESRVTRFTPIPEAVGLGPPLLSLGRDAQKAPFMQHSPISSATAVPPRFTPFTVNATRDWQLGEVAAQEGVSPYPPPPASEIYNATAWLAGYHLAYRRVHGRDWQPPAPTAIAAEALVLFEYPLEASRVSSRIAPFVREKIVAYALSQGAENADRHIGNVSCDIAHGQSRYVIGYCLRIALVEPSGRVEKEVMVSVDHVRGEYDLGAKLAESALVAELQRIESETIALKLERNRRRSTADCVRNEFRRVFGLSFDVQPGHLAADIQCISLRPLNPEMDTLLAVLRALPSRQSDHP